MGAANKTQAGARKTAAAANTPEARRKQIMQQLQEAVDYIDWKQGFYDDVLSGKTAYYSNLIPETTPDASESTAS